MYEWMFGETAFFHVMVWSHSAETTILEWWVYSLDKLWMIQGRPEGHKMRLSSCLVTDGYLYDIYMLNL